MKARVQKWGKNLALRIPPAIATEAELREDAPVELSLIDGRLVVEPLALEPTTLDELLKGVTDQNLHGEIDTGPVVGREAW
jgi:antitoxin MazE